MGDVISLSARRAGRLSVVPPSRSDDVTFFFDLSSPWTYLAAERVDRHLPGVRWAPAFGGALYSGDPGHGETPLVFATRSVAERRAVELGVPLIWPEDWPSSGRRAMRIATLAIEQGRAAPFVLAASRLAFCGGYDLDDPETLAEAAAAAGLDLRQALDAAGDDQRDLILERATVRLLGLGAKSLPAVAVGDRLYCGEARLGEAVAAATERPRPALRDRSGEAIGGGTIA